MKAVIDFSAFVGKNKDVIIKELTVVDIESGSAQHWIFKPPKDLDNYFNGLCIIDRHNNWLSKHYHSLDFCTGFSQYEDLLSTLNSICSPFQLLFAPDLEKATVLENIFKARRLVFSLEDLGCPPITRKPLFPALPKLDEYGEPCDEVDAVPNQGTQQCLYHHLNVPGSICTDNATQLADWFAENLDLIDMNKPTVREKTFFDWNKPSPTSKDLAAAGFVRVHSTVDATKCVYCGVVLCKWEEDDDPMADHDYNSPFCRFICFNLQMKRDQQLKDNKNNKAKNCDSTKEDDHFYMRFGNTPDVDETDLIKCCHA